MYITSMEGCEPSGVSVYHGTKYALARIADTLAAWAGLSASIAYPDGLAYNN